MIMRLLFGLSLASGMATAFVLPVPQLTTSRPTALLRRAAFTTRPLDLSVEVDAATTILSTFAPATSSLLLSAETQPWVQPLSVFLDIFLNFMSLAMLSRVVLSWYPTTKINDFPWILLVIPTEPLLRIVKNLIPPAFGVDITPVAWLALFTFLHEIFLGQQGLLTMKLRYGI